MVGKVLLPCLPIKAIKSNVLLFSGSKSISSETFSPSKLIFRLEQNGKIFLSVTSKLTNLGDKLLHSPLRQNDPPEGEHLEKSSQRCHVL